MLCRTSPQNADNRHAVKCKEELVLRIYCDQPRFAESALYSVATESLVSCGSVASGRVSLGVLRVVIAFEIRQPCRSFLLDGPEFAKFSSGDEHGRRPRFTSAEVHIVRLLLISNSTGPDGGYLDHCEAEMVDFTGHGIRMLFVPFAGTDEGAYGETAVERLDAMGYSAGWADRSTDLLSALDDTDVVFVGGGNTFLLLDRLYASGMLEAIGERVRGGMPYIGASAGSNVAGPTIRTTNDMPIVEPPSLSAMGLVPFQINPHYVDRDPDSIHQGETREQRLLEYLSQNETPVVALREGAMLRVENSAVTLRGSGGARCFGMGASVEDLASGTRLDRL